MYKNQLQELAQRSCFNLPSYGCIREGPDHAPMFKASVNFNGEIFVTPTYCTTLMQAEHAAAQVALNVLSARGPLKSLSARVLDETGVYKNLLQETTHRAGLKLPVYTTVRSGPGHVPVFTCSVELADVNFTGEPAKTKKQAEKNAAIAALSSLKRNFLSLSQTSKIAVGNGKEDQINISKVLSNFGRKDGIKSSRRDQNPAAGRRMLGGHCRDTAGSSNSLQYQQKRLLGLLMDSASSEGLKSNNSSFVSLLPPRRTSKILPQTSSNSLCSSKTVMSKSKAKMQVVTLPLDEHQGIEAEWLNGKSELIKLPIEKEGPNKSTSRLLYGEDQIFNAFSLSNTCELNSLVQPDHTTQSEQKTHMEKRLLGAPTQSHMAMNSSFVKAPPPCINGHMGRSNIIHNNGGSEYYHYPQRIAPAVQIRSAIPVCAAAPPLIKESAAEGKSMTSVHNGAVGEV